MVLRRACVTSWTLETAALNVADLQFLCPNLDDLERAEAATCAVRADIWSSSAGGSPSMAAIEDG
jgi:hypothetical protein